MKGFNQNQSIHLNLNDFLTISSSSCSIGSFVFEMIIELHRSLSFQLKSWSMSEMQGVIILAWESSEGKLHCYFNPSFPSLGKGSRKGRLHLLSIQSEQYLPCWFHCPCLWYPREWQEMPIARTNALKNINFLIKKYLWYCCSWSIVTTSEKASLKQAWPAR